MKNKLRKVILNGHGYSGIEVHYESPQSREGMDVLTFNKSTNPLAVSQSVINNVQRMKFYFMMLFSMISQDDEKYLTDLGDGINHDLVKENDNNEDSQRIAQIMALSQRVFITKLEIDEYNNIVISADYEMVDGRTKNYSTLKLNADDEFPRYYDAIKVGREIFNVVSDYAFESERSSELVTDIRAVLMELLPSRKDEIDEMDEQEKKDLYRSYLEEKGHIVISEDDMTDEDPDSDMYIANEDDIVTGDIPQEDNSEEEISQIPGESENKQKITEDSFS